MSPAYHGTSSVNDGRKRVIRRLFTAVLAIATLIALLGVAAPASASTVSDKKARLREAQATLELMKEHGFGADEVESVTVYTYTIANIATGKGVPDGGSFVSAQFSIPYVVSACLLDGAMGPGQLTEERMGSPDINEFIGRVSVAQDDDLNALYPEKTASRVAMKLKDGRSLERQVDVPRGDPSVPMEADDIADKLKRFSGDRNKENTDKLIELVLALENLEDIRELTEMV